MSNLFNKLRKSLSAVNLTFFLLIPAWVLVYTGLRISMPKFVSPFMEVTAWMLFKLINGVLKETKI